MKVARSLVIWPVVVSHNFSIVAHWVSLARALVTMVVIRFLIWSSQASLTCWAKQWMLGNVALYSSDASLALSFVRACVGFRRGHSALNTVGAEFLKVAHNVKCLIRHVEK